MTKKSGRLLKKRILIGVIVGLCILAVGAGGAYHYYLHTPERKAEADQQNQAISTARKQLNDTAFRGDRELASQYMEKVQRGELKAAYAIYTAAAAKLDDDTSKIALYNEATAISSKAKQMDHAIQFALLRSELSNDHRSLANVADLYKANNDVENQRKYLQLATEQLEQLPKDSGEYIDSRAYYQTLLSEAGSK